MKLCFFFFLTWRICHRLGTFLWGTRVAIMTTNSSLLEDNIVLQSFGPLDEALHFGVTHIGLTFVVPCCGDITVQFQLQWPIPFPHICSLSDCYSCANLWWTSPSRSCLWGRATSLPPDKLSSVCTPSRSLWKRWWWLKQTKRKCWQVWQQSYQIWAGTVDLLGHIRLKISGWEEEKTSRIKGLSDVPSTAWIQRYVQYFSGPKRWTWSITDNYSEFKLKYQHFLPLFPLLLTLSTRPTNVTKPMTSHAELLDKFSNSDL